MAVLTTRWFGAVLLDDEGRAEKTEPFPADADAIADRIARIAAGQVLDEERKLAGQGVTTHDARLASVARFEPGPQPTVAPPETHTPELRHEASLTVAARMAQTQSGGRDLLLAKAVRALDETQTSLNALGEILREWDRVATPDRAEMEHDRLARTIVNESNEQGPMAAHAEAVKALAAGRDALEEHAAHEARALAPNLCAVVTETIAARLIMHAGSLERLAQLPAGTVQTLGAETALFAHIKKGKDPPKHGVLFQHIWVNGANPRHRGRIARRMAGAAAQAARIDHYGRRDDDSEGRRLAERLKADIDGLAAARRRGPGR